LNSTRRRFYLVLAFLAGVVACALWPAQVVTLRLPEDEDRLTFAARLPEGERVVWRYRHSVEQTWVEGVFEVHPGNKRPRLVLVQTRYGSTGTGLPTDENGRIRREGDFFVVDEPERVEGLTFRLQELNQAVLVAGQERLALQFLPSGSLVRLTMEITPAWRYYLWRTISRPWLAGES
jgi:hypothetical protein